MQQRKITFLTPFMSVCPTVKWRGLWSIPSWMLLWRWLMMAVRMVDKFITWAHWARPRVKSSFQQARTMLVFASWLKETEGKKRDDILKMNKMNVIRQVDRLFPKSDSGVLTQELRRLGWSVPSAWRGRGVWMQTRRCSEHSDTRAWGWAWSTRGREPEREKQKARVQNKEMNYNKPLKQC